GGRPRGMGMLGPLAQSAEERPPAGVPPRPPHRGGDAFPEKCSLHHARRAWKSFPAAAEGVGRSGPPRRSFITIAENSAAKISLGWKGSSTPPQFSRYEERAERARR